MKKWIGIIVILVALILGGYYGMGLVTEKTLRKNVSMINQSNGLTVHIDQFSRGLYHSTADLTWQLHVPARMVKGENGQTISIPAEDYTIKMPLQIDHGPIIFSNKGVKFGLGFAHSDVSMPPEYTAKFSSLFTDQSVKPNLSLSLFVSYLNHSHLHIDVPTFKLVFKHGGDLFQWGGMDSYLDTSSTMQNISGGLSVHGASLVKNNMKAILGEVQSDYALHLTEAGIYLGDANFSVPSFVLSESDQKIFALEEFKAHSSSDIDGGLFSSHFSTSFSKMDLNGKSYGPMMLEMALKNLDAGVLAEINNELNKVKQGSDVERRQTMLSLLPQLPKLLSKGAQFEISKLSFVVPEGTIDGSLSISIPNGGTGNPFQLLQKLVGQGKLEIPEEMLKRVIVASVKQKLSTDPSLQQAVMQQMKNPQASGSETLSSTAASQTPPLPAPTPTVEGDKQVPAVESKQGASESTQASSNDATTSSHGDSTSVAKTPQDGKTVAGSADTKAGASGQNTPATTSAKTTSEPAKPLTDAEIENQAQVLAKQKLDSMTQSGLLTLQNKEYVIELNLSEGQLTVNGKPFTQKMMQF